MYSREIDGGTYTFEASGGLLHAALVMMDRETDSHWSLLQNRAIWGPAKGKAIAELPGAVKVTWGEWRRTHPDSKVLSVEGVEHGERNPYERYFSSEKGFRGLSTEDDRLPDKQLIYAFHHAGMPHAVPFSAFEGGAALALGDGQLFLYRHADDSFYRSTSAYLLPPGVDAVEEEGRWRLAPDGPAWDPDSRSFDGPLPAGAEPFGGFDTFWYSWSLTNEGTVLLR